jgi:hypothetical protein
VSVGIAAVETTDCIVFMVRCEFQASARPSQEKEKPRAESYELLARHRSEQVAGTENNRRMITVNLSMEEMVQNIQIVRAKRSSSRLRQ